MINAKVLAEQEGRVQNDRMGAIQRRLASKNMSYKNPTKKNPTSQSTNSDVESRKQVGY